MKKMIIALLCVLTLFTLSACGDKDDASGDDVAVSTTVCTIEVTEGSNQTVTLESKSDVLLKQTNETVSDIAALGMSEEELNTSIDNLKVIYGSIEGVTYSAKIEDGALYETFVIDYENGNFEDLMDAGIIQESDEIPDYISLELSIGNFEAIGYTCE